MHVVPSEVNKPDCTRRLLFMRCLYTYNTARSRASPWVYKKTNYSGRRVLAWGAQKPVLWLRGILKLQCLLLKKQHFKLLLPRSDKPDRFVC